MAIKPSYGPLEGCALHFINYSGKHLAERYGPYHNWLQSRRENGLLPYAKAWKSAIHKTGNQPNLNFAAHDYLGLSTHAAILSAAQEAIGTYGIHNASSPTLTGRTELHDVLEHRLARLLDVDTCMLFATGWMAGFGVMSGLANAKDTIVLDKLAHNCLQTGAAVATQKILKFNHNDLNHLENILRDCRQRDGENGLFVVTEGLYSMNSDAPNLPRLLAIIDRYEAILVIDVAHDFVVNGERGLGLLETISLQGRDNVVVMGSFSKTLATNGGFVAGPRIIRNQVMFSCPSYVFSTAISSLQCVVALKALDVVFSAEGAARRSQLRAVEQYALTAFHRHGFETDGFPSAIIPVIIGTEKKARLVAQLIENQGLVVNLVEFPAVPKGRAILRFLLTPAHTEADIDRAVSILAEARAQVEMNASNDSVPLQHVEVGIQHTVLA